MRYYEFNITVADNARDALTQKVMEMGCPGVIEEGGRIIAYFPDSLDINMISDELASFDTVLKKAGLDSTLCFEYCVLPDTDWNETWKKSFTPIDAGGFTIVPPWEKCDSRRLNLIIDPGMAFGTGHHEHVTGLDTDPLAIDAAQRNIALNSLGNIEIKAGTIEEVEEIFDFIAANLISETLINIAPQIASRLKPSGISVLSGMLSGQENDVIAAIGGAGLIVEEMFFDGKWVSVIAKKA